MSNEIVKQGENEMIEINKITAQDVINFFCPTATTNEVALFLKIAQMNGLNPFKRELHLVKYGDSTASIVTGYETYLKRADRTDKWGGFKAWTEGKIPDMKACIEVYRKDWERPLYHEVKYSEYVCLRKSDGKPTRFWNEKPETMLKKVVISQAFRLAFPLEFGGMPYTAEEINHIDIEQIETKQVGKPDVEMPQEVKNETTAPTTTQHILDKPEEKKTAVPAKVNTTKLLSIPQEGLIRVLAKKLELTDEDIKEEIAERYKIEHIKALTMKQASEMIEMLNNLISEKDTKQ